METRVSALPRGTALARFCLALGAARGDAMHALEISRGWVDTPQVPLAFKSIVSPGGLNQDWGSELASAGISQELIAALLPLTVLGKIQSYMRAVPFRTNISREQTVAASAWIESAAPTPAHAAAFDNVLLEPFRSGTIIVFTKDLLRFGVVPNPNSEAVMRTQLTKGVARFLDAELLDPAVSPIPGVRPGALTYRAVAQSSSGPTAANILSDLLAMVATLAGQGCQFTSPFFVMQPGTALALAGKFNTAGAQAFPDIRVNGGNLLGVPVIVSTGVPREIVLLDAAEMLLADDGAATIDASGEASLQMSDNPSDVGSPIIRPTSLWGQNLWALKAVREISWRPAHNSGDLAASPISYQPTCITYMATAY